MRYVGVGSLSTFLPACRGSRKLKRCGAGVALVLVLSSCSASGDKASPVLGEKDRPAATAGVLDAVSVAELTTVGNRVVAGCGVSGDIPIGVPDVRQYSCGVVAVNVVALQEVSNASGAINLVDDALVKAGCASSQMFKNKLSEAEAFGLDHPGFQVVHRGVYACDRGDLRVVLLRSDQVNLQSTIDDLSVVGVGSAVQQDEPLSVHKLVAERDSEQMSTTTYVAAFAASATYFKTTVCEGLRICVSV